MLKSMTETWTFVISTCTTNLSVIKILIKRKLLFNPTSNEKNGNFYYLDEYHNFRSSKYLKNGGYYLKGQNHC